MISEEKVRYMTKMAAFENQQGRECEPMKHYFRKDYVSLQLIKSFFTGTIAFLVVSGIVILWNLEQILEELNTIDYRSLGQKTALIYGGCMALYLILTYVIYQIRYSLGRKKLKRFYGQLRRVEKIAEEKTGATQEL